MLTLVDTCSPLYVDTQTFSIFFFIHIHKNMHKLLHIQSLRVSLCRCVKRDYLYIWHILNQFFANSEIYFCVAPGRTPYRRFVYSVR